MNPNQQLNQLRQALFDHDILNAVSDYREFIDSHLNKIISSYEYKHLKVFSEKQKLEAKKKILEENIIPLLNDPLDKGLAWSLHSHYLRGLGSINSELPPNVVKSQGFPF